MAPGLLGTPYRPAPPVGHTLTDAASGTVAVFDSCGAALDAARSRYPEAARLHGVLQTAFYTERDGRRTFVAYVHLADAIPF